MNNIFYVNNILFYILFLYYLSYIHLHLHLQGKHLSTDFSIPMTIRNHSMHVFPNLVFVVNKIGVGKR